MINFCPHGIVACCHKMFYHWLLLCLLINLIWNFMYLGHKIVILEYKKIILWVTFFFMNNFPLIFLELDSILEKIMNIINLSNVYFFLRLERFIFAFLLWWLVWPALKIHKVVKLVNKFLVNKGYFLLSSIRKIKWGFTGFSNLFNSSSVNTSLSKFFEAIFKARSLRELCWLLLIIPYFLFTSVGIVWLLYH